MSCCMCGAASMPYYTAGGNGIIRLCDDHADNHRHIATPIPLVHERCKDCRLIGKCCETRLI